MNNAGTLTKLEWGLLLNRLASYCQTKQASTNVIHYSPSLQKEEIIRRWQIVAPLRDLYSRNYSAPIGELNPINSHLKSAELGQILDGEALRDILALNTATYKVHQFAYDFAPRYPFLNDIATRLQPQPGLRKTIEKTIDKDGLILDTASSALASIRQQKSKLARKIEEKLSRLFHDKSWELYLQDNFFTLRSERYVLPIRIEGRTKVSGLVVDTSHSGQTLFVEPSHIAEANKMLQELNLSEKLEIIRILKTLSQLVASHSKTLELNYGTLIELDQLSAEARMAFELNANAIRLSNRPCLNLKQARHPLLQLSSAKPPIANCIALNQEQRALILTGPNAGGKTVVLKTVGTILLMAKAGLLIPAHSESELYLFAGLYIEMGDSQSISNHLSTFSGHLTGLQTILRAAGERDLVLLDEIAVGTEPQTGAAIAQACLEALTKKGATIVVTTHFENLKSLAQSNGCYRNASMEYSRKELRPSYKLLLDLPGQSFGIELAEQIGMDAGFIQRAKTLKGAAASNMDEAIAKLYAARQQFEDLLQQCEQEKQAAEAAKMRWKQEVELIAKTRQRTSNHLKLKYSKEFSQLRSKFDAIVKHLKQELKSLQDSNPNTVAAIEESKRKARRQLEDFGEALQIIASHSESEKPPGTEARVAELKPGDQVYVVPLGSYGKIEKLPNSKLGKLDITVGIASLKVDIKDVRKIEPSTNATGKRSSTKKAKPQN